MQHHIWVAENTHHGWWRCPRCLERTEAPGTKPLCQGVPTLRARVRPGVAVETAKQRVGRLFRRRRS